MRSAQVAFYEGERSVEVLCHPGNLASFGLHVEEGHGFNFKTTESKDEATRKRSSAEDSRAGVTRMEVTRILSLRQFDTNKCRFSNVVFKHPAGANLETTDQKPGISVF